MLFLSLIILRRFSLRSHSLGLEFNVPLQLLCFHMSLLKKNKDEYKDVCMSFSVIYIQGKYEPLARTPWVT